MPISSSYLAAMVPRTTFFLMALTVVAAAKQQMPMLVTGCLEMRNWMGGFTLLELLVVIMIVGLMAGLIGLVNGDTSGYKARREAQRLQNAIAVLREDAVLNGIGHGIRIEPELYTVMSLDQNDEWLPSKRFIEHQLPNGLRLNLLGSSKRKDGMVPQIVMLADDQITPFKLLFEYHQRPLLSLSSDGVEEVRLEHAQ